MSLPAGNSAACRLQGACTPSAEPSAVARQMQACPRGVHASPPELVEAGARHEQQAAAGQLLAQAAAVGTRLEVKLVPI